MISRHFRKVGTPGKYNAEWNTFETCVISHLSKLKCKDQNKGCIKVNKGINLLLVRKGLPVWGDRGRQMGSKDWDMSNTGM